MELKHLIKKKLIRILKKKKVTDISIHVEIPGTLQTIFTQNKNKVVTNLTILGLIDARDVKYIRNFLPRLSTLDLSGVTIKAYNGANGTCNYSILYPADEMPKNSFYDCYDGIPNDVLSSIILPTSLTRIGYSAFFKCTSLEKMLLPSTIIYFDSLAVLGCTKLANNQFPYQLICQGEACTFDNSIRNNVVDYETTAVHKINTT